MKQKLGHTIQLESMRAKFSGSSRYFGPQQDIFRFYRALVVNFGGRDRFKQ